MAHYDCKHCGVFECRGECKEEPQVPEKATDPDWKGLGKRENARRIDLAPVKSDGGSSSYYTFPIRNKKGEEIVVETADVIRAMVGNDFGLGNILKACRRIYMSLQGAGKVGTSVDYDANKIQYFADEVKQHATRN